MVAVPVETPSVTAPVILPNPLPTSSNAPVAVVPTPVAVSLTPFKNPPVVFFRKLKSEALGKLILVGSCGLKSEGLGNDILGGFGKLILGGFGKLILGGFWKLKSEALGKDILGKLILGLGKLILGLGKLILGLGKLILGLGKLILGLGKLILGLGKLILGKLILTLGSFILGLGSFILGVVILTLGSLILGLLNLNPILIFLLDCYLFPDFFFLFLTVRFAEAPLVVLLSVSDRSAFLPEPELVCVRLLVE